MSAEYFEKLFLGVLIGAAFIGWIYGIGYAFAAGVADALTKHLHISIARNETHIVREATDVNS